MTQFESKYKKRINLVSINADQRETPEYKKYSKFLDNLGLPATIWLDTKGKVLLAKDGAMTLPEMTQVTEAQLKKLR